MIAYQLKSTFVKEMGYFIMFYLILRSRTFEKLLLYLKFIHTPYVCNSRQTYPVKTLLYYQVQEKHMQSLRKRLHNFFFERSEKTMSD